MEVTNDIVFDGYAYGSRSPWIIPRSVRTLQISRCSSPYDPDLRTVANGGYVINPNGYDMVFVDADGYSLPYEVSEYNPVTGYLLVWVKVPALSKDSDTTIYMCYSNSSITTPQESPEAVWSTKYGGVSH